MISQHLMNSNYCQTTLVMTFCYFAFVFLFLALFLIGKNDWLWTFSMIFKYEKPCWTKRPNLTRRPDSFLSVYNSDLLTVFQDLLLWRESVTAGRFMVRELKWFVSTFYFSFSSCCFSLSMCTFKVFFFFLPFLVTLAPQNAKLIFFLHPLLVSDDKLLKAQPC